MKRYRLLAWTPILLLASLAALTFWLDRSVKSGSPLGVRDPSNPDVIVEDFSANLFNPDGSPRYALVAHRMEHRTDEDSTALETPTLTHYMPGKAEVQVRSEQAHVSHDAKEVVFTGNVRIVRAADARSGPITVTTSQLNVFPDQDLARSDKEVTITGEHGTLKGVGLEFNNLTRQMRLRSRVRGEFKNPRSPPD